MLWTVFILSMGIAANLLLWLMLMELLLSLGIITQRLGFGMLRERAASCLHSMLGASLMLMHMPSSTPPWLRNARSFLAALFWTVFQF